MAIDEPVIVLKSFKFITKAFIVCLVMCEVLITESVAQRCSVKKVFLEKKGVLRNFAKFPGKHLCQSLFFNKVVGLRPATLLKNTLTKVFSCEFCEISNSTFFYRTAPVAASVIIQIGPGKGHVKSS